MNGVVVLNEIEAVTGYTLGFSWLGLLFGLVAVVLIVTDFCLNYGARKKGSRVKPFTSGVFAFVVLCTFFGVLNFCTGKEITEPQYEIYMPGEVNMTEFTKHYEIVDQRGLIYTVRDLTE